MPNISGSLRSGIATTLLLLLTVCSANGQAFGTKQGAPLSEFPSSLLNSDGEELDGYWIIPPVENPSLKSYLGAFSPTLGLCAITGLSEEVTPTMGASLAFYFLEQLQELYGPPDRTGVGFNQLAIEGLLAARQTERIGAEWVNHPGRALPDEISAISIKFFTSGSGVQLGVSYLFTNMAGDRCVKGGSAPVLSNEGL
jgi:hypothetical protein